MNDTSLFFSQDEFALLTNENVFITRKSLTQKLTALLGGLHAELERCNVNFQNILPAEVLACNAKISRGENYRGFPWMILDYPRVFHREDVFAFRSLCWWAHDFSFTIHLSGKYFEMIKTGLADKITKFNDTKLYICVADKPWEYHYEKENYILLEDFLHSSGGEKEKIFSKNFLKISKRHSLEQIAEVNTIASQFYNDAITTLFR